MLNKLVKLPLSFFNVSMFYLLINEYFASVSFADFFKLYIFENFEDHARRWNVKLT